ncbi:hypothetical protein Tco_0973989 [Tanacetum coccineum]|uniref:Uncharacterized protein n=1 Tax=Tanacetum coccineum TaxID=301880 RepID=A0ABQ5EB83_9ASTR
MKRLPRVPTKEQRFYGYASKRVSKHDVYSTKRILVVTNVKVKEWYGHGHLDEIEVRRLDQQLYKFIEGDFPRLHLHDIEDMLILPVQNRLFNLKGDVIVHLAAALQSYQKKFNISRPMTHKDGITDLKPYSAYSNPQGFIYVDKLGSNKLMCSYELYKFSDGKLISLRDTLKDMANNLEMGYTSVMPRRRQSNLDKKRISKDTLWSSVVPLEEDSSVGVLLLANIALHWPTDKSRISLAAFACFFIQSFIFALLRVDSSSRMELYIENRENGRMILNSVQNGPLVWPTVVQEDGTTRTKKYEELSVAEKLQADYIVVPVFTQGDDLIAYLNKEMAFLTAVASSRVTVQQVQGRQGQSYAGTGYKGNATSFRGNNAGGQAREKAMLAEAQESSQILDEEQLAFLADIGIPDGQAAQTTIPNNAAFQTEDLDVYDSDCDDVSTTQAVMMANLSKYGSDVISEEKDNQEKNNESLTAELERYKEQVKTFEQRFNIDLSTREKMIDSQMDDMIKEKLAFKQQIDSLEQNLSNQIKEKESLLQTFTIFKNESKEKESKYMDKEIDLENKIKEIDNIVYKVGQSAQTVHIVMSSQHAVIPVIDDEETLILDELNRLSEDFGKRFVPQQELSAEQAFWLQTSHPNTDQSATLPVKIKAPRNFLSLVPVFTQGDDPIARLNKVMAFLSAVAASRFPSTNNQLRTSSNSRQQATIQDGRVTVQQVKGRQCIQPKRLRNAAWFKDKVMLAKAQESGQILDKEQLTFLVDPGIPDFQATQTTIPNNDAF